MIEKIKNSSNSGDGSLKNKILEDFDKALKKGSETLKPHPKVNHIVKD